MSFLPDNHYTPGLTLLMVHLVKAQAKKGNTGYNQLTELIGTAIFNDKTPDNKDRNDCDRARLG